MFQNSLLMSETNAWSGKKVFQNSIPMSETNAWSGIFGKNKWWKERKPAQRQQQKMLQSNKPNRAKKSKKSKKWLTTPRRSIFWHYNQDVPFGVTLHN